MFRRRCGISLLGLLVTGIPTVAKGQSTPEPKPRITLGVCDKVGLDVITINKAQSRLQEIFKHAGVDVTWTLSQGDRAAAMKFDRTSWEGCEAPSVVSEFFVIISNGKPSGWPREAMGFSAPPKAAPHRLYVLNEAVNSVISRVGDSNKGSVLAHVIAHELGHLLISREHHSPSGIMSTRWQYGRMVEIVQGTLRFASADAHEIRTRLQHGETAGTSTAAKAIMLESGH
jgi:hypothetical protein